ncbi:MAG: type II methionyl aminopeptidase [Candidatus Brockarchaeota archaeon]|nr:type II methionyl aminopeptidase [Candidatus Brockarchaeota archaeon]
MPPVKPVESAAQYHSLPLNNGLGDLETHLKPFPRIGSRLLNEEEKEKYFAAGEIAKRVKKEARQRVKAGVRLVDLCEEIEGRIRQLGGLPAFPCNIGLDEVAAHFTPPPDFEGEIPQGSLVKVDLGVHVDGCIVDTAFTIPLSQGDREIVEAAEKSLEKASGVLRSGVKINQIGEAVESVVKSRGFRVIRNLTGHQIDRFNLHAGLSIPNLKTFNMEKLRRDMVVAIEPFVTLADGLGEVSEAGHVYIYRFKHFPLDYKGGFSNQVGRMQSLFRTLPFCERWFSSIFKDAGGSVFNRIIEDLGKNLISYPVLVERSGKKIAQAEDTFLILEDSAVNLTSETG